MQAVSPDSTVSIAGASRLTGFSPQTLRRWSDIGAIPTIVGISGHRRYRVSELLEALGQVTDKPNGNSERKTVLYVRCSTSKQKQSLENQTVQLKEAYPNGIVISDIGSGIADTRKGMNRLIDMVIRGEVEKVVCTYQDRFNRFGIQYLERFFNAFNCHLEYRFSVDSTNDEDDFQSDMTDILNLFTVFCNRRSGRKAGKLVSKTVDDETLKRMIEKKEAGASDWDITLWLAENGVSTNRGGGVSYHVVRKLLKKITPNSLYSFEKFIRERMRKNEKERIDVTVMYREYEIWCRKNKHRPLSRVVIGRGFVKNEIKIKSNGTNYLVGWELV